MSTEVWGLMPKSQEDSETVEQAISRIVEQHNDDPTAHLGAGQSIAVHRAQDIIDHKAGSILADKWTYSEQEFSTTFENLSAFYTLGTASELWPGFTLEPTGAGYANRGEVQIDGESGQLEIDFAREQLLQVIFNADIASDGQVIFGLFSESVSSIKKGFGVEINGTTMNFFASNEAVNSFHTLNYPAFEALKTYVVRMFYSPIDDVISCFVNGSLIGTITWPSATWQGYAVVRFIAIRPTTSKPVLNVKSLYLKISPPVVEELLDSEVATGGTDLLQMQYATYCLAQIGVNFIVSAPYLLTKAVFSLSRNGTNLKSCRAILYELDDDITQGGEIVGSALATSDEVTLASLSTSLADVDFVFSPGEQYALLSGHYYLIVLDYTTTYDSAYISVEWNSSSSQHGNYSKDALTGNKYYSSDAPVLFSVYGTPNV
jgi:hypothetical protein